MKQYVINTFTYVRLLADPQKAFWNFRCIALVDKFCESAAASPSLFVWQNVDRVFEQVVACILGTFATGAAGDWKNDDRKVCLWGFLCTAYQVTTHSLQHALLHLPRSIYSIHLHMICEFMKHAAVFILQLFTGLVYLRLFRNLLALVDLLDGLAHLLLWMFVHYLGGFKFESFFYF